MKDKKPKNQVTFRTGGVGVGMNACLANSSAAKLQDQKYEYR